jgi:glutathione peroxidase-family protein
LRSQSVLFDKNKASAKKIPMNFAKFLLNEKGEVVKYFDPLESLDLVRQEVEKLLS